MVTILYSSISIKPSQQRYEDLIAVLPLSMQQENRRFVQWDDRLRHLCGKLLLREALMHFGFGSDCLHKLYYNEYRRPYISPEIDFNISHAGNYICCAIGKELKLGIDIEEVKPIALNEFSQVMTDQQWQFIHGSSAPLYTFFSYWTIKESVIKAETLGLAIPLTDIYIKPGIATYKDHIWHLKQILIEDHYCICLACNEENEIDLQKFSFW